MLEVKHIVTKAECQLTKYSLFTQTQKCQLSDIYLTELLFLAGGIKKYWYICPAEILMMTAIEKSKG